MRKCKTCNQQKFEDEMKTQQRCLECDKKQRIQKQKQYNSKRGQKIKPVSDKLKKEWKEYSQKDVFREIAKSRPSKCYVCGGWIQGIDEIGFDEEEVKSYYFAHILPKSLYPKYKLWHKNIALVCSIHCHDELDNKVSKKSMKIVENHLLNDEPLNL